jgi:hypothetical protein
MAKKGGAKKDKPVYSDAEKSPQMASGYSKEELQEEGLKKYKDRDAKQEQEIAQLKLRISNMENVNVEEQLRQKVEEMNNIKDAHAKKMKNTVELQKLKYEKEIHQIKYHYTKLIDKIRREHEARENVLKEGWVEGDGTEFADELYQRRGPDYDKMEPEEKLSRLVEVADNLYLYKAGVLYREWHADMAGKMSITGLVSLSSVSLDRFDEKVRAHMEILRASEADFMEEMNLGYPDVALDTYFSNVILARLEDIAKEAGIADPAKLKVRMSGRKGMIKKGANALVIRNAFAYEVDMLADEMQKRKNESDS